MYPAWTICFGEYLVSGVGDLPVHTVAAHTIGATTSLPDQPVPKAHDLLNTQQYSYYSVQRFRWEASLHGMQQRHATAGTGCLSPLGSLYVYGTIYPLKIQETGRMAQSGRIFIY